MLAPCFIAYQVVPNMLKRENFGMSFPPHYALSYHLIEIYICGLSRREIAQQCGTMYAAGSLTSVLDDA